MTKGISPQIKIQQEGKTIAKTDPIKKNNEKKVDFPVIELKMSKVNDKEKLAFCLMDNKGGFRGAKKLGEFAVSYRALGSMFPQRDYTLSMKDSNGQSIKPIQCYFRRVLTKKEDAVYQKELNVYRQKREDYKRSQAGATMSKPKEASEPTTASQPTAPTVDRLVSNQSQPKQVLDREMSRPVSPTEEKPKPYGNGAPDMPVEEKRSLPPEATPKKKKKKKKKKAAAAAAATNFDFDKGGFDDPFGAAATAPGGPGSTAGSAAPVGAPGGPAPPADAGFDAGFAGGDPFADAGGDPFGTADAPSANPKPAPAAAAGFDAGFGGGFGDDDPFGDAPAEAAQAPPKGAVAAAAAAASVVAARSAAPPADTKKGDPFGNDNDPFADTGDPFGGAPVEEKAAAAETKKSDPEIDLFAAASLPTPTAATAAAAMAVDDMPPKPASVPPPKPASVPPPKPASGPPPPPKPVSRPPPKPSSAPPPQPAVQPPPPKPAVPPPGPPAGLSIDVNAAEDKSKQSSQLSSPEPPPLMSEMFKQQMLDDDDDDTKSPGKSPEAKKEVLDTNVNLDYDDNYDDAKEADTAAEVPSETPVPALAEAPSQAQAQAPPPPPPRQAQIDIPEEDVGQPAGVGVTSPVPVKVATFVGAAAAAGVLGAKPAKSFRELELERKAKEEEKAAQFESLKKQVGESEARANQAEAEAERKEKDMKAEMATLAAAHARRVKQLQDENDALRQRAETAEESLNGRDSEMASNLASALKSAEESKTALAAANAESEKWKRATAAAEMGREEEIKRITQDLTAKANGAMGALRLEVDSLRSELQEKDIELMDVKDSRNEEVDFLRDQLEETQDNEKAARAAVDHERKSKLLVEEKLKETKRELEEAQERIRSLLSQRKRYTPQMTGPAGLATVTPASRSMSSLSRSSISSATSTATGGGVLATAIQKYRNALRSFASKGLQLAYVLAGVRSVEQAKQGLAPSITVFGQVHKALLDIRIPQYFGAIDKQILALLREREPAPTKASAGGVGLVRLESSFFLSLKKGYEALSTSLMKLPAKSQSMGEEMEKKCYHNFGTKAKGALMQYKDALAMFVTESAAAAEAARTAVVQDPARNQVSGKAVAAFSNYHQQLQSSHLPLFKKMLDQVANDAAKMRGIPFLDHWNKMSVHVIRLEAHFFDAVIKQLGIIHQRM